MTKLRLRIPTLFFVILTSMTISLVAIFSVLWYYSRQNTLETEFAKRKQEIITNYKERLTEQVNTGIDITIAGLEDINMHSQEKLKIETLKFKDTCLQLTKYNKDPNTRKNKILQVLNIIANTLNPKRSEPFPFIINLNTKKVVFPSIVYNNILDNTANQNTFNKRIAKIIDGIITNTTKTRRGYYFNSLFEIPAKPDRIIRHKCYTLHVPQLNIIVGCSYYDDHVEATARKHIFTFLSKIRSSNNSYIYVFNTKGIMLYHPTSKYIGQEILHNTDINGVELAKECIALAKDKPEGGFIDYVYPVNDNSPPSPKIAFVKKIPRLNWLLVSSIFVTDFDEMLKQSKDDLEEALHYDLQKAGYMLILIIFIEFAVSLFIFSKAKQYINIFTRSLKQAINERSLLNLEAFDLPELQEICINTNNMLADLLFAENELKELTFRLEEKVALRTQELQTKSKQLEDSMKQANSANQAKSNFLANMSHEIRTPMNIVLGMQQLLLDSKINNTQHNYLTKANQAAMSLLGIINDILDFSKIEAGRLHIDKIEMSIEETTSNILSFMNFEAAKKNIELIFNFDMNLPCSVLGDPLRLRQIISNLCNNAIKFSSKGNVIVTVQSNHTKNGTVYVDFKVQDNGIGISPDKLKDLFTPFKQADSTITRKYGGTGLGLVICKQLIELQGGRISCTSIPGNGTTFTFTLPFIIDTNQPNPAYQIAPLHNGERVLLIDSNPLTLYTIKRFCINGNFTTDTASSLADACNMIKSRHDETPRYHTILINSIISNIEARVIMEQLKHSFPLEDTNFILMTQIISPEIIREAKAAGFSMTICKPIAPGNLMRILENPHDTEKSPSKILSSINFTENKLQHASILIVEDNAINQEILENLLKKIGCNIAFANDGAEAVEQTRMNHYDLIFMDIQMPIMDGLTATREIRKFDTTTPIIAMTAHAMREDYAKSIEAGMNEHVTKPVKVEKLYNIIKKFITLKTSKNEDSAATGDSKRSSSSPADNSKINSNDQIDRIWTRLVEVQQLDLFEALENTGRDKELLINIYRNYLTAAEEALQQLKNALTNKQTEEIFKIAHTLKGTCGTLGATNILNIAEDIVNTLRTDKSSDTTGSCNELITEIQLLITQLQKVFNS